MARCVKRRKLPYLGATLRSAVGNTGAVRRYITQRGGSVACHSTIWRSATIHYKVMYRRAALVLKLSNLLCRFRGAAEPKTHLVPCIGHSVPQRDGVLHKGGPRERVAKLPVLRCATNAYCCPEWGTQVGFLPSFI